MNTLSSELRLTIVKHLEIADRKDIVAIAAALCANEASAESARPLRPAATPGKRFEVIGETVRDSATGLTWTRGNVSTERLEWQAAKDACEKLVLDGGGWRIPTIKELLTLVDYERHSPAIDPVFTCEPNWYWSSTPYAPFAGYSWSVYFYGGGAGGAHHGDGGFVRAVRGGQY